MLFKRGRISRGVAHRGGDLTTKGRCSPENQEVYITLEKTGQRSSLISVKFRVQLSDVSKIRLPLSKLTQERVSYGNETLAGCMAACVHLLMLLD